MPDEEQTKAPPSLPPRPITKTEFKELSLEARLSILHHEAHRLDENCIPDALMTLSEAFANVAQSFHDVQIEMIRLQKTLEEMPPIEDDT